MKRRWFGHADDVKTVERVEPILGAVHDGPELRALYRRAVGEESHGASEAHIDDGAGAERGGDIAIPEAIPLLGDQLAWVSLHTSIVHVTQVDVLVDESLLRVER